MPDIFTAPNSKTKTNSPAKPLHAHRDPPEEQKALQSQPFPGIFSAFIYQPAGFTFSKLEKDEKIIIFARRHFITNFPWIAISVIALIIPPLISIFLQVLNLPAIHLPLRFNIIINLSYYILIFGFAFYNFIDWFYNIGIVTQKRFIDIDFINLSYIDVAATTLVDVEDVSFVQTSFFASLFDYGDVIARTVAGKEETFVFEKLPHPAKAVDIISKLLGG